jgi:hypothetical protein
MTTNSPNPVDGDVQAQPVAWAHRLVNKLNGTIHPWVYGSKEKEPSEGDIFRVEVKPLYDTPPAQVLRPVELPAISAGKYYTEEGVFMAFDYKRDLNAAIRAAGGEVKND